MAGHSKVTDGGLSSGSLAPDLLAGLERNGAALIAEGHPGRLAPHLPMLLAEGLAGRPWAALLAAAILHDVDRTDTRTEALLDVAEGVFVAHGDERGHGYVAFVRGSRALGSGDILEAAAWWRLARERLVGGVPTDEALVAMLGLEAYQAGRLPEAIACAEESLALARLRRNARQETSACVFLAFFLLTVGKFGRATTVLDTADEVCESLLDPADCADLPLLAAARGTIEALRGNRESAHAAFDRGLDAAEGLHLDWHKAIVLAARAEVMAHWEPDRSLADGRRALTIFEAQGETWWRTWAIRALAVAATEQGDTSAALVYLDRLLDDPLPLPERARTLMAAAEAHLRCSELPAARDRLLEAHALYEDLGFGYWQARTQSLLAHAEPAQGALWSRRSRQLSDGDPAFDYLMGGRTRLAITLLGQPRVTIDGHRCRFDTRNAEIAVYLLALAPSNSLHTEALAERLWPEGAPDRQSGRIRTLLWQIRRALTPAHAWRISSERKVIHLDLTSVDVDVLTLTSYGQAVLRSTAGQIEDLPLSPQQVLDAIRHPLLPAWQYKDWVIDYQKRLDKLRSRLEAHHDGGA